MPPRELPPRSRHVPKGLAPEDFDTIREAVLETARGRWFLDEYADRIRSEDTAHLIHSMQRLETAVAANHDALMDRLATALRPELHGEAYGSREPSRPFEASQPFEPAPKLAPRHMKYFRSDEDIFEPAPEATIAAVPSAPTLREMAEQAEAEKPQDAPAKRRIIITRHKPGEQIEVPLEDELAQAS